MTLWTVGQDIDADTLNAINRTVYKTGNESLTSNTTQQNDDHLALAVLAGWVYTLELELLISGATGGDFAYGFTFPASSALTYGGHGLHNSATTNSGNLEAIGYTEDTSSPSAVSNFGVSATPTWARVAGMFSCGTNGTLQLQWAQFASSGTATVLHKWSWMRLCAVSRP